jgi:spore maturation protein CgeB
MKIALISDELTRESLNMENTVEIFNITPQNYKKIFTEDFIDFLFVESSWHGYKNSWKFKVASYSNRFWRTNYRLKQVIKYAKKNNIPTVFWNKEDDIHFNRFIESAKLFDHIFTVDENCINKYREIVPKETTINTLMFAVQPKLHYFKDFNFKYNQANFVGSYSHHIHNRRREWQDMMFESATKTDFGLTIYDRNSNRGSKNYRYPNLLNMQVKSAVPYSKTADIYRDYLVSLNVNTIENSPTMFSRRLIEVIACGGIAVTNPTLAVEEHFGEYSYVVRNKEEMDELFNRLKYGASKDDMERMRAGAEFILKKHTWKHRLKEILEVISKSY